MIIVESIIVGTELAISGCIIKSNSRTVVDELNSEVNASDITVKEIRNYADELYVDILFGGGNKEDIVEYLL